LLSALKKLITSPQGKTRQGAGMALSAKTPRGGRKSANQAPAGVSPEEVDTTFYGLLLGVRSPIDSSLNDFEKKSLRELDRLLASNVSHSTLVPRLPAVIPRIMGALRDEASSASDLASELGRDPVLVSEVLRLANSPYYRVGREITSMERAVCVLGRVGVRQLVTSAAFRPLINLNSGHFTRLSGTLLWDQSEKAAVTCDCIARQQGMDRFNAYLAAIVANVGLTVALRVLDSTFDGRLAPRSTSFHRRLVNRSGQLSGLIAREWGFPKPVLDALDLQVDTTGMQGLGNILYASDKLSKLHILRSRGYFKGDIQPFTRHLLKRFPLAGRNCVEALPVWTDQAVADPAQACTNLPESG